MTKINKKYKDRLFRMAFCEKKDLLELYNAMNGSSYSDPEVLEIVTLDDVIYMGLKRGLFYFSDEYRKYIEKRHLNIYGSRRVMLPVPQYVVFYNGPENRPERSVLPLSQSFCHMNPEHAACIELKATVININRGYNETLMKQCKKLRDYAEFTSRVRDELKEASSLEEAVELAVDYCIRNDILAEFLSSHRAEVCEVILTEYDEEMHIASEKEISREEGLLKGREEGRAEGIRALIMDNLEKQVPEDIIIQKLQRYFSLDKEKVTAYLSTFKKEYVSIYGQREKI